MTCFVVFFPRNTDYLSSLIKYNSKEKTLKSASAHHVSTQSVINSVSRAAQNVFGLKLPSVQTVHLNLHPPSSSSHHQQSPH